MAGLAIFATSLPVNKPLSRFSHRISLRGSTRHRRAGGVYFTDRPPLGCCEQRFPNPRARIYNQAFMDAARIAALLAPFIGEYAGPAAAALFAHISTYVDILMRWNSRINLTAIRDPEQIVTRHFGESLFAARHLFPLETVAAGAPSPAVPASPISLADVGSGAGFPGIPIKLWAPAVSIVLIESNHKKGAFLREVSRSLILTDINIYNGRAEAFPPNTCDVVTLRAVERFHIALPVAAGLLKPHGRLALLISSAQLPQVHSLLPDHHWSPPLSIPQSTSRILLLGSPPPSGHEPG